MRSFAIGISDLWVIYGKVAGEMDRQFKNGVPSPELDRDFRARHRDMKVRSHEQKDAAKIHAEYIEHLSYLNCSLHILFEKHPKLQTDAWRTCYLYETEIFAKLGQQSKLVSDLASKSSVERMGIIIGKGKNSISVMNFFAWKKLPPFFIFGKNSWWRTGPSSSTRSSLRMMGEWNCGLPGTVSSISIH